MFERPLDWLVVKWQWPAASMFAACFFVALAPFVFHVAGAPLGLVYLQLPIYMFHQYEEHTGDRFRLYVNRLIGHGQEVLTPIATFWINSLLVWGLDLVALYLAVFVDLSLGLMAIYLPLLNSLGHLLPAIKTRKYNPGVITSAVLFIPLGSLSAVVVSRAANCGWGANLFALGVAIVVHAIIIVHVRRRLAAFARQRKPTASRGDMPMAMVARR